MMDTSSAEEMARETARVMVGMLGLEIKTNKTRGKGNWRTFG